MLKIGRSYFNESQIAAIQPSYAGDTIDVYLVRGAVISERIREDDLQEVLEAAGLLQFTGNPLGVVVFTRSERDALFRAWEDGYLFAAKDRNGQVFAYSSLPGKFAACWDDHGDCKPLRLIGDFDALSFEDDVPLDLTAFFSFQDGSEEGEEE